MSSTQSTLLCHYRYDPLDRLIDQTQPDQPTHQRFYCKSRLATEIQGTMRYSILQHEDLLLAQQQRQGDEVSATLLVTDLQRSVLHTLEKNHQRQAIVYAPYGHRCTESGLTSLLGFNGERPDTVTGHYLLGNGYRAFNSVLMRFNSPDSLSPFGKGGLNPYTYCFGDPRNQIDPTGNVPLMLNELWRTVSQPVKDWRVRRLISKNEKISALIDIQKKKNFEQLYTKTLNSLESELAYPDNGLTLATLSNRKLASLPGIPPDMAAVINRINFNLTKRADKIIYTTRHAEVKADLTRLDNIATRDKNGAISELGVGISGLKSSFRDDIYANVSPLINKLNKNNYKISKIRNAYKKL